MKAKQLTTQVKLTAEDYKASLPTRGKSGVNWTIETYSIYVNLLYPQINVVPGQAWTGVRTRYKYVCSVHGQYETKGVSVIIERDGCQCRGCQSDKAAASAGIIRQPRGTKEEKELGEKLRAEGLSYAMIGHQLGRSRVTIKKWLDPVYREKARQDSAKWKNENRERHNANNRRYSTEFEHGRACRNANDANRRLLKQNTPEFVFFDNEWHEVDRKETYKIFSEYLLPSSERKAMQELYLEAQHQTETTGIEHHVDHIWPLSVGGEHRMFNLQILPATENLSKQNTFREEDQTLIIQRLFN